MLAEEFVRFQICSIDKLLKVAGYCVQHQVTSQPTFRPVSHYIHSAAPQALQQSPSQRPGRLLR